jgi:beta-carotene 15,15'-dioxygenase
VHKLAASGSAAFNARLGEWHSAAWVAAVVALAALIWLAWPVSSANAWTGATLFLALSLTLGLAHGAADVWLIARYFKGQSLRAWALYAMAVLVLAWVLFPWPDVALAALLLLSIWHFGEGFEARASLLRRAVRGGAPLALAYFFGQAQLMEVVQLITASQAARASLSWQVWAAVAWVWLPLLLLWVWLAGWPERARQRVLVLELVLTALLFVLLPPLVAFALYFGLYHSLTHLLRLLRSHETASVKRGWAWALLATALLLTWGLLASLLPSSAILAAWSASDVDWAQWLQATVVVLAAVSAPHGWLISRWAKLGHTQAPASSARQS